MHLGQSMFALAALALVGYLTLNTNRTIVDQNDRLNRANFGITAVALAQSLTQEAMSKYFDARDETQITGELHDPSELTPVNALGHGPTERYRNGTNDFNDFDDYNNLFLVYKSTNPADTASTSGSDWEKAVPNLDSKYFLKARVQYIDISRLSDTNEANDTSAVPTWHKRLRVTVINPTSKDTLVTSVIMSYWN